MSLLLDALKRAEQEKLARTEPPDLQVVGQGEAARPAAHAAPAAAPAPKQASAAAMQLEPIASPAATAKPATSAQAAQAIFQAKAAQAAQAKGGSRRGLLYGAIAAILIAIAAAGGYVWYQMKALAPATAPVVRGGLTPPAAPTAPPAGTIPEKAAPVAEKPAAPAPATPSTSASKAPAVAAATAPEAPKPRATRTQEQIIQQVLSQAPATREPPLRLDRSVETPRIPQDVANGYEALRHGDLAAARRSYQSALAADANSIDAQLGMATIDARSGQIAGAASRYRRVLELDPRNVTALAGLAALADASRPGNVEAQLRQDLMSYPQSAALHLALGNLLAAQARWSEAQPEYFEAHRLDPGNADIAHNLAVSLDNLGQSKLAMEFYRRALAGAREQASQIDVAAVTRRMSELEAQR